MRKNIIRHITSTRAVVLSALLWAVAASSGLHAATPEVLQPEQNAVLEIGADFTIYWTWENLDSVFIDFSPDSGDSWTSLSESPVVKQPDAGDFGRFAWTVPDNSSERCLVRIYQDSLNQTYRSTIFSIRGLILTSPLEGAQYNPGDTVSISFSTTTYTDMTIDYSNDGGETWHVVVSGSEFSSAHPDWGSYPWVAPEVESERMLIRLYSESMPVDTFYSGLFTITQPLYVTITSPNGGEQFCLGDTIYLSWTWFNRSGDDHYHSVVPRLLLNGGLDEPISLFPDGQIVHNTARKDTFWVIPQDTRYCTKEAFVTVNEYGSSKLIDYSDSSFSIVESCQTADVEYEWTGVNAMQSHRYYRKPILGVGAALDGPIRDSRLFRVDGTRVGGYGMETITGTRKGRRGMCPGLYLILRSPAQSRGDQ